MMKLEPSKNVPEALGKALIAFSELDMTLGYAVGFLLMRSSSSDDEGRIFRTCVSFAERITAMEMTFQLRVRDAALRERMADLASDLRQANALRNRMVHDEWIWSGWQGAGGPESIEQARVSKRGDLYPPEWLKPVGIEDLRIAAERFLDLIQRTHKILNEAYAYWKTAER